MDKICNICNKAKVASVYNKCCKNCKMDIVRSINYTILTEKNNILKFFSTKKSKVDENNYYYDKDVFYNKIKESITGNINIIPPIVGVPAFSLCFLLK